MAVKSIKILCRMDFPSKTVRLWDGAGPYLDTDGEIWSGMVLNEGLDQIESALNGEASTLTLSLSGVAQEVADLAFDDLEQGEVIGSRVQLLIQDCDQYDQPVGAPQVRFTGTADNLLIDDTVANDQVISTVMLECTNRFDLRSLVNGSVLSDVDQKARSAVMNPGAPADRFAERIAVLIDKTVVWPRYT
jgi:hypothetical protein